MNNKNNIRTKQIIMTPSKKSEDRSDNESYANKYGINDNDEYVIERETKK